MEFTKVVVSQIKSIPNFLAKNDDRDFRVKRTVSVISSAPPCKDDNAQFTTVPFKTLFWKKCWRYRCFHQIFPPLLSVRKKCASHFLRETAIENKQKPKHGYLIHTWSDKAFKGTVVNQALPSWHGGSLKIPLTVPLS